MKEVSASEIYEQMFLSPLIIIDLRDKDSHMDYSLEDSISLFPDEAFLEKFTKLRTKHPEEEIYFVCYRGNSSKKVIEELEKLGFQNLINIAGGMEACRKYFS